MHSQLTEKMTNGRLRIFKMPLTHDNKAKLINVLPYEANDKNITKLSAILKSYNLLFKICIMKVSSSNFYR